MAKFNDVISNTTQYPDATEWTLPDGTKTTVGEMRTDLRNTFMPKDDFTRGQQKAAQERSQLEQSYQVELYKAQQAAEQFRQQLSKSGQSANTTDDLDTYIADPTFGPMARKLKAALERTEATQQALADTQKQLKDHEQVWWLNQHAQVLRRIQDGDSDMKDQGRVNEFLGFAKQNGFSNLDTAYQLFTRNRDIERARDTASKEAYERAKTDMSAPKVPTGANQSGTSTAPSATLPSSLDDAEQLAKNDPEIGRLMEQISLA